MKTYTGTLVDDGGDCDYRQDLFRDVASAVGHLYSFIYFSGSPGLTCVRAEFVSGLCDKSSNGFGALNWATVCL